MTPPRTGWALLLLMLMPPGVVAADPADPVDQAAQALLELSAQRSEGASGEATLTLEDILAIALRDNPGLASKGAQLQNRQASASASFRKMLPTLALSATRSDIQFATAAGSSEAESFGTTLTLTQPIYRGGALWSGWKSSQTQEQQAKLEFTHAARTLTKEVKAGWYALLEKRQLLKEAEAAMTRLHQHEKNAQAFFREGRIWRNEILQASVKVAQGEQNLITARNQVELAKAELNRLMRRPMDHPLDPSGALTWAPMNWTLAEAYAHARRHRTDLERSRLEIEVGKSNETSAASAALPSVTLTGSYTLDSPTSSYHENDATLTTLLSVNWTAWNWGQTGQEVTAAKAGTLKNQLVFDDQLQSVLLETRKAFLASTESAVRIEVIKKSLQQAEENYRVNQIRYREQLGTATDVLDAMDLLTNTRNTYTSALATYLTSMAALDLAVGKGAENLEMTKNATLPAKP
ncbi:MAG: TolC family protein [Magnetococcales bacterium]|nr:TolC family protein [Magnetococcales bacterium]